MREKPDTSTVPKEWTVKEQIEEGWIYDNIDIDWTKGCEKIEQSNKDI